MEQESLLTDIGFNPIYASPGKRFLNLLIDTIIMYGFVFVIFYALAYSGIYYAADEHNGWAIKIFVYVLICIICNLLCVV